jgi:hypothetical protein
MHSAPVVSSMGHEGRRDRLMGWQRDGETVILGGIIFLQRWLYTRGMITLGIGAGENRAGVLGLLMQLSFSRRKGK